MGRLKLGSEQLKIGLLLLITLVAAFYRLYRIADLPPGDDHDPAFYGLDALSILQGHHTAFFPSNFGREALFSYIVALCFAVFGAHPYVIHMAAAFVGILTVPALYCAAGELFAGESKLLEQWGGLLAALVLALSYWHLNWSRFGVRSILVPFFAALAFYFLWLGLRKGSRWAFVACGLVLGLSLYTYQAARLFPLLILIGFGSVVWQRKSFSRPAVTNLILVAGVALLVFAPLGHYFLTHPGSFSQRIEQTLVSTSGNALDDLYALVDRLVQAISSLHVLGESTAHHSTLPGRPALEYFFSILFVIGLAISLTRIRQPRYFFLLAWWGLMLLPVLAGQGIAAKRALGALPAIALLVAVGILVPWQALRRANWQPVLSKVVRAIWCVFISLGFISSGVATFRDYFVAWASNPDLFTYFEVGVSAIGSYIGTLPPDERIYISPDPPEHPAIRFNSGLRDGIRGYNGRACLVVPAQSSSGATFIVAPGEDGSSLDLLQRYLPQGKIVAEGPLHYNKPYFLAYHIPAESIVRVEPVYPIQVDFGAQIQLVGYDLDVLTYRPGETIHLNVYYRALQPMMTDYTVFTHLLGPDNPNAQGSLWSQDDSEPCRGGYATSLWTTDEIVADRFNLPIPADAPPGEYELTIGFYSLLTMERLPVLNLDIQADECAVSLGSVLVSH
ncbi:MAG: glycosyltransferase family 39 protein [Thermoflexales bacterium]|nr:glycosyltransferase family 39 protein [Thermoflexales bacterium]